LINFFDLFRKQKPLEKPEQFETRPSQTREVWDATLQMINGYVPLTINIGLYDLIREAIPVWDVAISKRTRLIGDFEINAFGDNNVQEFLEDFKRHVPVGFFGGGLNSWIVQLSDSALSKGFGIGELVPNANNTAVDRMKIAKANWFRFIEQNERLVLGELDVNGFSAVPMENENLIYYLAFNQRDGHPQGIPLAVSLPFMAQVFLRMQKSIENLIWRIGDPSFVAALTGGANSDYEKVKNAATAFRDELTKLMTDRRQGMVRDASIGVPNGGAFNLQTLGETPRNFDFSPQSRFTLEQIIAVSEIPPFMFGMSWSTTERMSAEQSDNLISVVESNRMAVENIIYRVLDMALILNGMAGKKYEIKWYPVNLKDDKMIADSRLANAQAVEKEIAALIQLMDAGLASPEDLLTYAVDQGLVARKSNTEEAVNKIRDWNEQKKAMALCRILENS
jgi:hypothetical protein